MIKGDRVTIRQIAIMVNKFMTVEFSDSDGIGYRVWHGTEPDFFSNRTYLCDMIDLETGEVFGEYFGYSPTGVIKNATIDEHLFTFIKSYLNLDEIVKIL